MIPQDEETARRVALRLKGWNVERNSYGGYIIRQPDGGTSIPFHHEDYAWQVAYADQKTYRA